jgi:GT2 family glycosyltransferase
MQTSVVILNWNGREFLEKCVPSVVRASAAYGENCEVVVLDNASSDNSIDYLKSNFPQVRILALKEKIGFAAAMNTGIKAAKYDIVIGLNNDIIVDEGFIAPLAGFFSESADVFAVAAKMLHWDKKTLNFGRTRGDFKFGFFRRSIVDSPFAVNTMYACAGAFAVDKEKFLMLGGFDEDMDVYWEDADLCYRAWKRGWKTVYEPQAIVYHKFHGTYGKEHGLGWIDKMSARNYLLFLLKNMHDKTLCCFQVFSVPFLMLASLLIGRPYFTVGFLSTPSKYCLFWEKRRREKALAVFSDRQVLKILAS